MQKMEGKIIATKSKNKMYGQPYASWGQIPNERKLPKYLVGGVQSLLTDSSKKYCDSESEP